MTTSNDKPARPISDTKVSILLIVNRIGSLDRLANYFRTLNPLSNIVVSQPGRKNISGYRFDLIIVEYDAIRTDNDSRWMKEAELRLKQTGIVMELP